jgi:hypothetical protein
MHSANFSKQVNHLMPYSEMMGLDKAFSMPLCQLTTWATPICRPLQKNGFTYLRNDFGHAEIFKNENHPATQEICAA